MVRKSFKTYIVFSALACVLTSKGRAADLADDVQDPASVRAYERFWSSFEQVKRQKIRKGVNDYEQAMNQLEQAFESEQRKITEQQIKSLSTAIDKYRKHLETEPGAENRAFVMLNLAQMLKTVATISGSVNESQAQASLQESLSLLVDIEKQYPNFVNIDDAYHLHASTLETLKRAPEAEQVWRKLADRRSNSIYAVYANTALGDFAFEARNIPVALSHYDKAQSILTGLDHPSRDVEMVKVSYRIAWAAYKSTDHKRTIKAAEFLLSPGVSVKTAAAREKIRVDAVELIGDSLYEQNNIAFTKKYLEDRDHVDHSGAVGLRVMKRYYESGIFREVIEVANPLTEVATLSIDYPSILLMAANAAGNLKQIATKVEFSERLALLLPQQSLWMSKNGSKFEDVKSLQENGVNAAKFVADYHYDAGLASGSERSFRSARTFFDILISSQPNFDGANTWRLRRANCYYFMDDHDEARKQYVDLIENFKLDNVTLEVAMYQLVLTSEKIWRKEFDRVAKTSENPLKSKSVADKVDDLEVQVDRFAKRFPAQSRSIDLILVAASANRDQERFDRAIRFWQRSLISNPNAAQRSVAIRGIVFASIKSKTSSETLKSVIAFLKLEDAKSLDQNLESELRGVLSAAVFEEASSLTKDGQPAEAGQLQVAVAREFPNIPRWNEMFRDGAYSLAIANEWFEAQKACEDYLAKQGTTLRADMQYLLARSHEYQLRLGDASKSYLELAKKYPQHLRSALALERSEKLAAAEGNLIIAAEAASLAGDRNAKTSDKLSAYDRAATYRLDANDINGAKVVAQKRLAASNTPEEKFKSQILVARIKYQSGDEQNAIDELEITEKRIQENRNRLGDFQAPLIAEANLFLGLDAKKRFNEFSMKDRSGRYGDVVQEKSKLFEELVMRFDRAAAANIPQYSARARFEVGESADTFADDLASLPVREDASLTLKSSNRYNQNIQRLKDMSKRYHSNNILARNKAPDRYANNEWVQKSSNHLVGFGKSAQAKSQSEQVAPSYGQTYPSQWSAE